MSNLNLSAIRRRVPSGAIWTPTTPGNPDWWHSVELGRIWQDTAGTTAATTGGDPVARIDAYYGSNFSQSTSTLRPYLTTLGSRLAVRSDDTDDNLGVNDTFGSDSARTFACIFEIFSAPGASSAETIVRIGASPRQIILRHSGLSSSSAKGWHVAIDRTSANAVCIQGSSPALLSNAIHTIVVRYDGGGAASAGAYRIWLDGVEQTATTGGNVAASGYGRWLATSVPAEVCNCSVAETIVWNSALSESDCLSCSAYLEAMR